MYAVEHRCVHVVAMRGSVSQVGGVSGRRRAVGARARASEIGGAVSSHESVSPSILAVSIMSKVYEVFIIMT